MKIILLAGYPFSIKRFGDAEHVYQLSMALSKLSMEVHVLSFESTTRIEKKADHLWVHTFKRKIICYLFPWIPVSLLQREINSIAPDLIHLHGTTLPYVLAALSVHKRFPVVLTLHGVIEQEMRFRNPWMRLWNRLFMIPLRNRMVKVASSVILCSRAMKERLSYLRTAGMLVIGNGIDLDQYQILPRIKKKKNAHILFIGRLSKLKGVDLLLNALPLVFEKVGEVPVYIAGSGPESEILGEMVRKKQLDHVAKFVGYITGEKKREMIRNANMMVLPSRFENFPITIVEAMACGIPVVASRVGGIPEVVIDGTTGLLFEVDDVNQLADRITTILRDSALRQRLGDEAYRRSQEYSWRNIAERVVAVYAKSIDRTPAVDGKSLGW